MESNCPKCGEKLKEDAQFCPNCGEKVSKTSFNKYIILIICVVVVMAILTSSFLLTNQTQVVKVDNVEFELPADYVNQP